MSLKDRINDDMKTAMRARDSARLATIRLLMAAMKQKVVDERIVLDDDAILLILDKMLKQRRDSITQFDAGGRQDLADIERFEVSVLSSYRPAGLSPEEIAKIIAEAVLETSAKTPADMGKLMAVLKPKLAGRADMAEVSKQVKVILTP